MKTSYHSRESILTQFDRRSFLYSFSMGAMALSLGKFSAFADISKMGVVIHSYGKRFRASSQAHPKFTDALAMLEHCHKIGAGGVQVMINNWTDDFTGKVRERREKLEMYLEGSIRLPKEKEDLVEFEQNIKQIKEAGAEVVRTVCLGGRRYESFHSLEEFIAFKRTSLRSLEMAEPIVRKHKIQLAVENHKDWRVPELVGIMKHLDSEWIGVTLDFGNSVSLLESPMEVAQGLAPYAYSTHVKDMGVKEYEDGFLLSEVPLGQGICDLKKMVELCQKYNPNIKFSLEMITRDPLQVPCLTEGYWATFADMQGSTLAKTLKMVKNHSFAGDLPTVSQLDDEGQLAVEENNVVACLNYSQSELNF